MLLRAVFGLVILVQGGCYALQPNSTAASWIVGLAALVCGGLLIVGFLTPVAAAVAAAGTAGVGLSLLPACKPNLFDSAISLILGLTILVTVVGLGPGAFSLDARVFGRREIIIPPRRAPLP